MKRCWRWLPLLNAHLDIGHHRSLRVFRYLLARLDGVTLRKKRSKSPITRDLDKRLSNQQSHAETTLLLRYFGTNLFERNDALPLQNSIELVSRQVGQSF